MVTRE